MNTKTHKEYSDKREALMFQDVDIEYFSIPSLEIHNYDNMAIVLIAGSIFRENNMPFRIHSFFKTEEDVKRFLSTVFQRYASFESLNGKIPINQSIPPNTESKMTNELLNMASNIGLEDVVEAGNIFRYNGEFCVDFADTTATLILEVEACKSVEADSEEIIEQEDGSNIMRTIKTRYTTRWHKADPSKISIKWQRNIIQAISSSL
jgi:hypothetical protein